MERQSANPISDFIFQWVACLETSVNPLTNKFHIVHYWYNTFGVIRTPFIFREYGGAMDLLLIV